MNYPFWNVPYLSGGGVIALIATYHLLIALFAVGGGLYLAVAERKARREGRTDWLPILKKHSKFFLILTAAFGTTSGVGIWFAIGLANPEATSTLIHNFVFGWAIEYVFFIVELTTAAVYYYTWDKIEPKLHLMIGYIYAASSFLTLVIINGILTFMLTPGETWLSVAGSGNEASVFWYAFFNPTYFPSLFLRTLICWNLAGIWALVTAARIDGFKQPRLKHEIISWSAKWLIPGFVLVPLCFLWYLAMVPESSKQLLDLGISTIGQGTFTQVTRSVLITVMTSATILALVYFVAVRNSKSFGLGWAISLVLLAFAATAATEQAREMLRKPYVVGNFMYSNGVRKSEVEKFNAEGYLTHSPWAQTEVKNFYGDAETALVKKGELMFRGQCGACHTETGYRAMKELLKGRDERSIENILTTLHDYKEDSPYRKYMPPLVGNPDEIAALVKYLRTLTVPSHETALQQSTPLKTETKN
ncbi:MAG TPA: cytochrome ubiquinol oxidase subunit I [Pyrinomonadaceae bacterium]|nr:cytochrome ubiquinol oxidase subunit I [Pyrinomonadaceae bacterium]